MKLYKSIISGLLMLSCASFAANADETTLTIHAKTGENITFNFNDHPAISFNRANALIIRSKSTNVQIKGFSSVQKITFDNSSAGVTDIKVDADASIVPTSHNVYTLAGFKAGTQLTVTDLHGIVHQSQTIDGPEPFELSLDGYATGYYIIAAGEIVCKVAIN